MIPSLTVLCRRLSVLCVALAALHVFVCVLTGLSWNLKNGRREIRIRIPAENFWKTPSLSGSFWNREQQRLDFVNNPVFRGSEPPDWLNDTAPANRCDPDYRVRTQIPDYNSLPPRFQDFLLHMRCRTHRLTIDQPRICRDKPFLLLAVKSLVPHFDRRQAIRETWGRAGVVANRTVATVFLLGNPWATDHHPNLAEMLHHEAEQHRDLLQWEFRDTFFNLTLKDVLFLGWFSQNCPHAEFILKGDDDVFVNTLRILDLLEGLPESKAKELFVGDVISDAGPHRDVKLKYFVPESVFVGLYPPYAGGGGYLYSGELALRLHSVSQKVVLYPIDDVYTGMCLKKLGLAPAKHSGFRTFGIEEKFKLTPCVYRSLMLVHSRTPQEMLQIWPWIVHPELDCQ